MVKLAFAALLFASAARADSTIQECSYANRLYQQIQSKATNISFKRLDTEEAGCVLSWTPKPGQTIAFTDKKKNKETAKALALKWKNGTITPAEKDELLKTLVLVFYEVDS